jgi:hypothetical protein
MKLENQICTLEQAKRLKELGICQDGYFHYGDRLDGPTESWMHEGDEDVFYAAFTVAELGVMLDYCSVTRSEMPGYKGQFCFPGGPIKGECLYFPTEAQARAQRLIIALEKEWTTVEEVNNRLKAA